MDAGYELKINDVKWTIYKCKKDDEALKIDENSIIFGITKFSTASIFVRTEEMNEDIIYRTLKHELAHAYIYSFGFVGDDMHEENICNFIESHAENIVNDAKKIFKEFLKPKEE